MSKIALCAIGRYENRYAVEFVEYYIKLGFDKIFIYDNNFGDEEHFEDVLGSYITSGSVEIINWRDRKNSQLKAYEDCYARHGSEYDWIAFFDFDEFLVLKKGNDIHRFMNRYRDFDCLLINWMVMTDNNLVHYEDKPVMERFTEPMPFDKCVSYKFPENNHVKSIVRGGLENISFKNPHILKGNVRCCNTKGKPCMQAPYIPYDHSVAYIKHFTTKTIEEWLQNKVVRGYPDGHTRGLRANPIRKFFERCEMTDEKERYIKGFQGTRESNVKCRVWVTYHRDDLIKEYNLKDDDTFKLFPAHKKPNGDNINYLNPVYSEIVTLYYVWKNKIKSDYVGFNHYRRMFGNLEMPNEGNCQVYKVRTYHHNTVYRQYAKYHSQKDLDCVLDILNREYGDNNPYTFHIKYDKVLITNNCFLMTWDNFNKLCEFLFPILFEFAEITGCGGSLKKWKEKAVRDFCGERTEYQMRVQGFLAERLISSWIVSNLKYYV